MEIERILKMETTERDRLGMILSNRMDTMAHGKACISIDAWEELKSDILKWHFENSNSFNITDKDIATIEALHDLLLDEEGYPLNHPLLKRSRELTKRMYKALG